MGNVKSEKHTYSPMVLSGIDPFFQVNEEHFTTLLFIYSTNILVRKFFIFTVTNVPDHFPRLRRGEKYTSIKVSFIPQKFENVRPILTLLKMQPHYSQSSRENATPSSGTSSLAPYKEVRETCTKMADKEPRKMTEE